MTPECIEVDGHSVCVEFMAEKLTGVKGTKSLPLFIVQPQRKWWKPWTWFKEARSYVTNFAQYPVHVWVDGMGPKLGNLARSLSEITEEGEELPTYRLRAFGRVAINDFYKYGR